MAPPRERLHGDACRRLGVDDGLVVDLELAGIERGVEVAGEIAPIA